MNKRGYTNLKYCDKHDEFYSHWHSCLRCILEEDTKSLSQEMSEDKIEKDKNLQTRLF